MIHIDNIVAPSTAAVRRAEFGTYCTHAARYPKTTSLCISRNLRVARRMRSPDWYLGRTCIYFMSVRHAVSLRQGQTLFPNTLRFFTGAVVKQHHH